MKCPLRIIAISSEEAKGIPAVYDCIQEECAWWDDVNNQCAIRILARSADMIDDRLIAISKKMPTENQFRK